MSDQIGGVSAFKQKFVEARNKLISAGNNKPTTKEIIAAIKATKSELVHNEGIPGLHLEHNPDEPHPFNEYEGILDEQETIKQVFEKSILKDMKSPDDFAKLDLSKFTLIADAGPNKDVRLNPDTKEMITKETSEDGKTVTITYESYGVKHTVKFVDDKFSEGTAGVRMPNDSIKEYEYTYSDNGVVVPGSLIKNPNEKSV